MRSRDFRRPGDLFLRLVFFPQHRSRANAQGMDSATPRNSPMPKHQCPQLRHSMAEAVLSGNGSPNLTAPAQEVTRQAACGPKHWRQSEERNSQPTDYAARIGLSSRSRRPRRWILSLPSATSRERTVPRVARPTDHGTLGVLDPAHITGTPEQIRTSFLPRFLPHARSTNQLALSPDRKPL